MLLQVSLPPLELSVSFSSLAVYAVSTFKLCFIDVVFNCSMGIYIITVEWHTSSLLCPDVHNLCAKEHLVSWWSVTGSALANEIHLNNCFISICQSDKLSLDIPEQKSYLWQGSSFMWSDTPSHGGYRQDHLVHLACTHVMAYLNLYQVLHPDFSPWCEILNLKWEGIGMPNTATLFLQLCAEKVNLDYNKQGMVAYLFKKLWLDLFIVCFFLPKLVIKTCK